MKSRIIASLLVCLLAVSIGAGCSKKTAVNPTEGTDNKPAVTAEAAVSTSEAQPSEEIGGTPVTDTDGKAVTAVVTDADGNTVTTVVTDSEGNTVTDAAGNTITLAVTEVITVPVTEADPEDGTVALTGTEGTAGLTDAEDTTVLTDTEGTAEETTSDVNAEIKEEYLPTEDEKKELENEETKKPIKYTGFDCQYFDTPALTEIEYFNTVIPFFSQEKLAEYVENNSESYDFGKGKESFSAVVNSYADTAFDGKGVLVISFNDKEGGSDYTITGAWEETIEINGNVLDRLVFAVKKSPGESTSGHFLVEIDTEFISLWDNIDISIYTPQ